MDIDQLGTESDARNQWTLYTDEPGESVERGVAEEIIVHRDRSLRYVRRSRGRNDEEQITHGDPPPMIRGETRFHTLVRLK